MELTSITTLAKISAPLTKNILDTFLIPKLNELKTKWKRNNFIIDHHFENKFQEYLNESFEKNAIINTIALRRKKNLT